MDSISETYLDDSNRPREIPGHRPRTTHQLITLGMPTASLEEAQEWRALNTSRRVPTNGQNAGTIQITTKVQPKKRRNLVRFRRSGDPLFDTLQAARLMQREAFKLVMEASADGDFSRLGMLVSIHNKAVVTSLTAERMWRAELEARKVFVPAQEIMETGRRTMATVIRRLRKLAVESGPQCNPQDPLLAVNVLEGAVNEIMLAAQQAIRDFNSYGKQA